MRNFSILDTVINGFDNALRTICVPEKRSSSRVTPGKHIEDVTMSHQDKRHVIGLLRVNHAGEVCAQALYQGQALTAKLEKTRQEMQKAQNEEIDHLAWCEERLTDLGGRVSILNPIWYINSFMLGALAGIMGDGLSLGFVAETERQVVKHLQKHLTKIPENDMKTKEILRNMELDEANHAQMAESSGAVQLPFLVQKLMNACSKFLTIGSYYI
jgi:ubiquinone biosynthesis monooxygenase Coq7